MLSPRLRQVATLLIAIVALAGGGGYVLALDSLLELRRARAVARVGVYEHGDVVASAPGVLYILLFYAAVLGAVGAVLMKLAGTWCDRRPVPDQPDGVPARSGAPILLMRYRGALGMAYISEG